MSDNTKKTICPECKGELPYEPSTEAQFCELCGFRILPEKECRKIDKNGQSRIE